MKIKTADLIGPAIDWAVAKCEGLPLRRDPMGFKTGQQAGWWVWGGEGQNEIVGHLKTRRNQHDGYSPSTNWSQGGPIIEREKLSASYWGDKSKFGQHSKPEQWWEARHPTHRTQSRRTVGFGPTPLIAAMRCYCCAKLGEYVDIPEELCQRANS